MSALKGRAGGEECVPRCLPALLELWLSGEMKDKPLQVFLMHTAALSA